MPYLQRGPAVRVSSHDFVFFSVIIMYFLFYLSQFGTIRAGTVHKDFFRQSFKLFPADTANQAQSCPLVYIVILYPDILHVLDFFSALLLQNLILPSFFLPFLFSALNLLLRLFAKGFPFQIFLFLPGSNFFVFLNLYRPRCHAIKQTASFRLLKFDVHRRRRQMDNSGDFFLCIPLLTQINHFHKNRLLCFLGCLLPVYFSQRINLQFFLYLISYPVRRGFSAVQVNIPRFQHTLGRFFFLSVNFLYFFQRISAKPFKYSRQKMLWAMCLNDNLSLRIIKIIFEKNFFF